MEFEALESQLGRETGRVWAFLASVPNRFVGNKPRITAAAKILPRSVSPTTNVAFVGIRNSDG